MASDGRNKCVLFSASHLLPRDSCLPLSDTLIDGSRKPAVRLQEEGDGVCESWKTFIVSAGAPTDGQ